MENIEIEDISEDGHFSYFSELPDEIIIKIFSYLSPYTDIKHSKLVNRKWNRIISTNESHSKKIFYESLHNGNIKWQIHKQSSYNIIDTLVPGTWSGKTRRSKVQLPNINIPFPRFSHSAVVLGRYLYVFCGSTSESNFSSSTYNDLHRLDLSMRTWQKVKTEGLMPAPRECCSMVAYKQKSSKHLYRTLPYLGKLIIFGGWCQPPRNRVIIGPRFFDDTQIFHVHESRWQRLNLKCSPTSRAGHSASVIQDKMVLFGGSQRINRLNDVWVFCLVTLTWSCPPIQSKKPAERFGHSQFTLNDTTILIIGGCGGDANTLFGDVWLLNVTTWCWSQVKVNNAFSEAPDLWCHASVMINGDIITFSEEKECPYCKIPIQTYNVPRDPPLDSDVNCSCGRIRNGNLPSISRRHLQMYILNCKDVLNKSVCTWADYKYLSPSPLSRKLFTACTGVNEVLLFGGLINDCVDSNKLDNCVMILSANT
ncbi:F-box only protein 42 [Hydra vulgaris]|uniref:F-box only protein 42 n=1 Tax=Hydra vulgaris TaxID=6087 RepID=UPI001F5F1387|nr:F-box only protein 42 [Hydra vulgaris]